MHKQLLAIASLSLALLLAGCDSSTVSLSEASLLAAHDSSNPAAPQPGAEDSMSREVLRIIDEELPLAATDIQFSSDYETQACTVYFGKEYGFATIALPPAELPVTYHAKKNGMVWQAATYISWRMKDSQTLESRYINAGSEAISAGEFRRRVKECVRIASLRHHLIFSPSVRAANALSWAQSAEFRDLHSPSDELIQLNATNGKLQHRLDELTWKIKPITDDEEKEPVLRPR
jgi:hypothetical protein